MCGITGLMSPAPIREAQLWAMTDRLAHRGPDDRGIWLDEEARVGLGHRRLSIVDPSPQGHQPMVSQCGRWVLSYNGEIYNHKALRRELDGLGARAWRGYPDSETLLEAIAQWGLKAALRKCVGMFALAVWDRRARVLQLARDRFGEKPLYYGWVGGDFAFGSELKAIRALGHALAVSRRALGRLVSLSYVPAPLSIFEHVYKLEPGCLLTLSEEVWRQRPDGPLRAGEAGAGPRLERYWSYRAVVEAGLADPVRDEREALAELEAALAEAVRGQAAADVPVGALFSGGIDSSTIVALHQQLGGRPLRTFTLGLDDPRYNEAGFARQVAAALGTEHHECIITGEEARAALPAMPLVWDEPFGDSSQIPTWLVSRFARAEVGVALTGDGGDELFGGYARYLRAPRLWGAARKVPRPLRAAAGAALSAVGPGVWDGLGRLLPAGRRPAQFGARTAKWLRILRAAGGLEHVYAAYLGAWHGEAGPVLGAGEVDGGLDLGPDAADATRLMYADALAYLPDDILCKGDRAAMAWGLETRAPFLDHRVAALAARLPVGMKIRGGRGKYVLRELLFRHAPRALFERPKAGFAIPVGDWLRGPLQDWAEALLDERRLRSEGWFDPAPVRARWERSLKGSPDGSSGLWPILMFQAWLEAQSADGAG